MKLRLYSSLIFASLLVACSAQPTKHSSNSGSSEELDNQNCSLMPTIVEKTCVDTSISDQYANVLLLNQTLFDKEMQGADGIYLTALPMVRKLLAGEMLSEIEALELNSLELQNASPSLAVIIRLAKELQQQQAQVLSLTSTNKKLEVDMEKQAELIKRLKDISLGQ